MFRIAFVWGLALVGLMMAPASKVQAAGGWASGSAPVFRSDVERARKADAKARAARRKTYGNRVWPRYMKGGARPAIKPEAPKIVSLKRSEKPGTVIVDTRGRRLFYVLKNKSAYVYPITVGRAGYTWTGTQRISRIASWPSWSPPASMRKRKPGLPINVTGGLRNPLGAKALYLGSSIYRIHGTNNDRTIGRASSSGCIRMTNRHVIHLSTLVRIGTRVRVVRSYSGI